MTTPRMCLYLDESMTGPDRQYQPVLVTEGEAGYTPTDYRYGLDYLAAKAVVARANALLGLTQEDTDEIVTSSFRAHFANKNR